MLLIYTHRMHTYDLFSRLVRVRLVGVISGGTQRTVYNDRNSSYHFNGGIFQSVGSAAIQAVQASWHRSQRNTNIFPYIHDVCSTLTHYIRSHTQLW